MRPADAVDLKGLVSEMKKSAVTTKHISEKPWSLISVYSPYSPDIHVMLMETSPDRYLPGPEWIPEEEGEGVTKLIGAVLDFIGRRQSNSTIHAGYNWSPRSWGEEEEKTGFQSVPTKWHPMLWGWPRLDETDDPDSQTVEWVDPSVLSPHERRILGENEFGLPLCRFIRSILEKESEKLPDIKGPFSFDKSTISGRIVSIPFHDPLPQLFSSDGFFAGVLKPIAIILEKTFRMLTETFTTLDCSEMDALLRQCEVKGPAILERLRNNPRIRDKNAVSKLACNNNIPNDLMQTLSTPIFNRCNEKGIPSGWWRKGFGYALVLSASTSEYVGHLKIMPGVYVGPGGVVEAQGVILKRPEYIPCNQDSIEKSRILWNLKRHLSDISF
jgi:hypothetical protein